MNRYLLILLDKTVFKCLFYVVALSARCFGSESQPLARTSISEKHFLVIRPGGIGDGLMSLPMLKLMRQHFPENKLTLICLKKNKLAYKHVSCFDELIVLDTVDGLIRAFKLFSKRVFDVVFDLEPFRKVSAIIAYFSRAAVRIGFDTNDRRLLYTHLIAYPNEKYYESYNMIRQLQVLGLEVLEKEARDLTFPLSDRDVEVARDMLHSKEIESEKDFLVAIVPGVLKKHHRWRMSCFARLIELMREDDADAKILLLGVSADLPDTREVLTHFAENEKPPSFVGETSYTQSLGILKFCDVLVACDGGIVYMAAAMGCSTVSLWGPGVMERFKPPGEKHLGVRKEYACIPCVNYSRLGEFPACPYERKCINDISPEEVFKEYATLKTRLQRGQSRSHAVGLC